MKRLTKIFHIAPDDQRPAVIFLCLLVLFPFDLFQAFGREPADPPSSKIQLPKEILRPEGLTDEPSELPPDSTVNLDTEVLVELPKHFAEEEDSVMTILVDKDSPYGLDGEKLPFTPQPMRAVWMSALFPGLGQIYNRRFWKLPIVVGAFMGLGYGVNWNNNQYADYSRAYRDVTDSDPTTASYMDFFPPTTVESDLDKSWLTSVLKTRRDYYRRNRDLCIICCVGMYLLCILDAYVDASLAHFDITDHLSMDVAPAIIPTAHPAAGNPLALRNSALGLQWAFNF